MIPRPDDHGTESIPAKRIFERKRSERERRTDLVGDSFHQSMYTISFGECEMLAEKARATKIVGYRTGDFHDEDGIETK